MRSRNFIVARSCVGLADAAPPAMRTHAIRGRCSRAQKPVQRPRPFFAGHPLGCTAAQIRIEVELPLRVRLGCVKINPQPIRRRFPMKNIPAAIVVTVVFFSTINFATAQTAKPGGRTYEQCREAGEKRGYSNLGRRGQSSGLDMFIAKCMQGGSKK
jgi:hypothetical protein